MTRASTPVRLLAPLVVLVAAALGSTGCSSGAPPILDCRDARGIHPICGFHNPEDLSLLEDGHRLVVSQFGSMTDQAAAGSLVVLDLENEQIQLAYPLPTSNTEATPAAGWGDPLCPGPPQPFNPHGIDMARRGIHNDPAELPTERLDGKVETDHPTARRLFTLICVLHIRG